jgi:hypothetical protein
VNADASVSENRQPEPVTCNNISRDILMDIIDPAVVSHEGFGSIMNPQSTETTTRPPCDSILDIHRGQATLNIELDGDAALSNTVSSESLDTDPTTQGDDQDNQTPCEGNKIIAVTTPSCSEGRPISRHSGQRDSPRNSTVAVIIPTSQCPKPCTHKSSSRACRTGGGKRKHRSRSLEHDNSNGSDNDGTDITQNVDNQRRRAKRKRQLGMVNSNRFTPGTVARSPLGNFSLPDLHSISRGLLTCEIFSSEIVYSFTWKEDKDSSDHVKCKEGPQRHSRYERIDAQISAPRTVHKTTSANAPFTKEDDELLKRLKEEDRLPWKQIKGHFPGRTEGSLQVRYCTKLKDRASGSSMSTPSEKELDASSSPILEPCAKTGPLLRSRYGPPRSRRVVERYSPL